MLKIKTDVTVFWFRRDLRIADNHGLFNALKSGYPVLPVFIFDINILNQLGEKCDRRVDLIRNIIVDLQTEIAQFGSSLSVRYGKPVEIFEALTSELNIKAVYTNRDYEPYAIERDREVADFLSSKSISFLSFKDQVIFEWNEVLKADNTPYTVFTPYSKIWKQQLNKSLTVASESLQLAHNFVRTSFVAVPELIEIGFESTGIVYEPPVVDERIILNYHTTRDFPSLNGSSGLSVHLRFGTVSVRQLVSKALQLNEIWLNELIWREFFKSILIHFPYVVDGPFKKPYNAIQWRNNENEFALWCKGITGYPIVDAGMRQLNRTGYMHNRVRMIVASFLTKHLLIDWRWGEAYFARKLLDYDLSANNGNWQWAAGCGCDAVPYFRIFNPTEQTKRYDPDYHYVRQWVDEFDSPEYPQPVVEHNFARLRALNTYKSALNEFK